MRLPNTHSLGVTVLASGKSKGVWFNRRPRVTEIQGLPTVGRMSLLAAEGIEQWLQRHPEAGSSYRGASLIRNRPPPGP
jgi:hypothetical protein